MLIQKNPQLKEDAGWLKNIMLQHAYVDEKKVKLQSFHWNDYREVTANVCIYKTDKGEYMHPIDMNAEMAKRFANLEKFCNITDGGDHSSNARALRLQSLYAEFKAMPIADVKKRMAYIKRDLAKNEEIYGFKSSNYTERYDELYVIELLLKI